MRGDGEVVRDGDAMRGEFVEVAMGRTRGHDAEALRDGGGEGLRIGAHAEGAGGDLRHIDVRALDCGAASDFGFPPNAMALNTSTAEILKRFTLYYSLD